MMSNRLEPHASEDRKAGANQAPQGGRLGRPASLADSNRPAVSSPTENQNPPTPTPRPEQLKILHLRGTVLFEGADYLPAKIPFGALLFCPGTGEEHHVCRAANFRKGHDRVLLVMDRFPGKQPTHAVTAPAQADQQEEAHV